MGCAVDVIVERQHPAFVFIMVKDKSIFYHETEDTALLPVRLGF